MVVLPSMFENYSTFCKIRADAKKTGRLDWSRLPNDRPSLLVPLAHFTSTQLPAAFLSHPVGQLDFPIRLPKEPTQRIKTLRPLYESTDLEKACGGPDVFNYLVDEILDNVYQHSEFTHAFVMARKFDDEKMVELVFADDGLTIPGVLRNHGKSMDSTHALRAATTGTSTKGPERGYGLRTSIRLVREGFDGEFLLLSGTAAISIGREKTSEHRLDDALAFHGTLVGMRLPIASKIERFYDYIS